MAAENDILGISSHLDISDIQKSIDELINGLERIGIKADSLSKSMTSAMREIAASTDDSATKQKRAMDVLSQGMEEAKKALASYPDTLRQAKNEADATAQATARLETELNKLNGQFSGAIVGSKTYDDLKRSIAGVEQQIQSNNALHDKQLATIQEMESGYNGLISMYGVANTATAANAVAHGAVTAAVGVEAGAHAVNTEKIGEETKAVLENKNIKDLQVETEQKITQAVEQETASYDGLLDKLNQGKLSSAEYARTVDDLRNRIAELRKAQQEVGTKYDTELEKVNTSNMVGGQLVSAGDPNMVNALAQEYSVLSSQIGALEGVLSNVESAWNSMHNAAKQGQAEVTEETKRATEAEREFNTEADKQPNGFRQQWQNVNEMHDKIRELTRELREHEAEYDKLSEKPGFDDQSKKAQELMEKISNLKKEIADTKKEMSEEQGAGSFLARWKNQLTDAMTGHGKFQDSLGNMKTALGGLVAPFAAATGGAMAFAKALWSMAATPIGAILSAIALGLQAVHMWFTRSAEGQRAFTKISAYLGSLLSSMMDIAIKVGNYLYHAFTDPQGALNQFGRGLIGMVVNPLKAVGNTLAGVGQIAKGVIDLIASGANVAEAKKAVESISRGWDSLGKAAGNVMDTFKSAWDSFAGTVSGTVSLVGDGIKQGWTTNLAEAGAKMHSTALESMRLAEQQLDAQKALSEAKRDEAKLDIEIAKEREKIYTLTGKEKDAQIEKVKQMLSEKYDGQIAAQQKLLEVQQKRNKLHEVTLEQLAKEREAQGQVYALQARAAASTRMLVRMQQANLKSMANADKKGGRTQQQIAEANAAWDEVVHKNTVSREKAERDMESRITDARIAAMRDGAEKVRAEKERAFEKELEQLDEQRLAAIEAERNRQKAEHDAQEKIIKARGGKPVAWDDSMTDTSQIDAINKKYEELRKIAADKRRAEEMRTELESMRAYLKEYGTFQQQKLAIAEEYAEKIREAETTGNKWEAKRLTEESKRAQQQIEVNAIKQDIDWAGLLGGFGVMFRESLQPTIGKLQRLTTSDEFKASDYREQEVVYELINKLKQAATSFDSNMFRNLNNDLATFHQRMRDYTRAQEKEEEITRKLTETKEKYDKAKEEGDIGGMTTYGAVIAELTTQQEEAAKEVKEMGNAANEARTNLNNSADAARNFFEGVSSAVQNLSSGSLRGIGEGLMELDKIFGNGKLTARLGKSIINFFDDVFSKEETSKPVTQALSKIFGTLSESSNEVYTAIIAAILSILDVLKEKGAGGFISDILDAILGAIDGIIDNILSGQFIEQIVGAIVNGIGKIFGNIIGHLASVVSFGAIDSKFLFGGKDNHQEMLDVQAKLTKSIESTTAALNKMTQELERSYGAVAMAYGDKAEELIRKNLESIVKGIDSVLTDNYGGGHSDYYHLNKGQDVLQQIVAYGKNYGITAWNGDKYAWQELLEQNSPENLARLFKDIRDSGDDLWRRITQEAGYNDGALQEWIEKLIDTYDQFDETADKLAEQLTTTTKENVFDDFLEDLYNMADGAEDVFEDMADDWQKMVNRMTINNLVSENYKKQLEGWYDSLVELNRKKSDASNEMTNAQYKAELDALKMQYEEYAKQAKDEIEQLREMGIIAPTGENANADQQAMYNSLEKWSYDQADELISRATAMQIIMEHIYESIQGRSEYQAGIMQTLSTFGLDISGINQGIATSIDIQTSMDGHLAAIRQNTAPISEIRDWVRKIYNDR